MEQGRGGRQIQAVEEGREKGSVGKQWNPRPFGRLPLWLQLQLRPISRSVMKILKYASDSHEMLSFFMKSKSDNWSLH